MSIGFGYLLGYYSAMSSRNVKLIQSAKASEGLKSLRETSLTKINSIPNSPFSTPKQINSPTNIDSNEVLSGDDQVCKERISNSFRKLKDRAELPKYLNDLGLIGEGIEVGVRNGEHSKHILKFWKGKKLHMCDPWEHQDETLYKDISNREQSHQDSLFLDLQTFMKSYYPDRFELHRMYSVDAAKKFPNESLDFIYLDARHDYDGIKEDMLAWWPKLKTGGVFAGHDFVPDGTLKAGLFGVMKAVAEFSIDNNREFLSISSKRSDGGREEPQRVDGGWSTWYMIK